MEPRGYVGKFLESPPGQGREILEIFFMIHHVGSINGWDAGSPKRWEGGIGSIWGPPEGKDYKWYILPTGGWTMPPIPPFRGTSIPTIHCLMPLILVFYVFKKSFALTIDV